MRDAACKLGTCQVAQAQAKIVDAIGGTGAVVFRQTLGGLFHLCDGVGIKQLAQIGLAEQLAQLILINCEGLGTTLGQRRITVVKEVGNIAE